MSDVHEVIVHDVGKVIGRKPVALHDDEVILALGLLVCAVHQVGRRDGRLGGLEPDRVRLPVGRAPVRLGRRDAPARPRVVGGVAAGGGLLDVELQFVPGAEAPERAAALE